MPVTPVLGAEAGGGLSGLPGQLIPPISDLQVQRDPVSKRRSVIKVDTTYMHTHEHVHTHTYMHIQIYTCIHTCIYTYTHTHEHILIYTHTYTTYTNIHTRTSNPPPSQYISYIPSRKISVYNLCNRIIHFRRQTLSTQECKHRSYTAARTQSVQARSIRMLETPLNNAQVQPSVGDTAAMNQA